MYRQTTCKYGHPFRGSNLLLRPRTVTTTSRYGKKVYKYPNTEYVERVCRTCLNEQRERYRQRKLSEAKRELNLNLAKKVSQDE